MFQGLPQASTQIAQGATVYIFNRKDFSTSTASVVSVSQPHISKAAQSNPALAMQGFVIDLTLASGGENTTIEFPVNSVSASYPDKGWFVSADRLATAREVESAMNASKQYMAQVPYHEMVLRNGPSVLLELNPQMRLEAEQSQKIASFENRLAEMEKRSAESSTKLDKVLALLAVDGPRNTKKKEE